MGIINVENAQERLDSGFWNKKCISCNHDEKKHGNTGCKECDCPADPKCDCGNCEGMFS